MKKQTGKLVFLALTLVLTACGTVATTPKPTNQTTVGTQCGQDDAYYDGIVVIAQYYTLFEHGLYEDAYQLLSSSRPHANNLEEFVTNSEMLKIKEMRIVTIRPYCESISQLQTWTTPDPTNRKMFYAQVYVEGESGMAGAVENGVHTYFITLALENDEWKIYSINTAPLP